MKLIFPNGEHEPIALKEGLTLVGNGEDCQVMLAAPGIASHHCEIQLQDGQAQVRAIDAKAVTVLNGRQITQTMPFKSGDLLLFAKVGCRVVAPDRTSVPAKEPPAQKKIADEDDGRTRVRMAMPKFMLRGVSGPTFGKNFALIGTMTVGRQPDCDICIPNDEISRHHLKLQVLPEGAMVEDLGSANGSFINDKRVHGSGVLKPGDELRLDTVRFLLLAPGAERQPQNATQPRGEMAAASTNAQSSHLLLWIIAFLVVIGVIGVVGLRYLGKI